ncbi:MAG TPA: hypothetical protein VKY73_23205, partial [Polyangiaceae bacterium]|nr:hypothetical protein [Polyangiaceae bacterium]
MAASAGSARAVVAPQAENSGLRRTDAVTETVGERFGRGRRSSRKPGLAERERSFSVQLRRQPGVRVD